jgi:heterodisulfide reductase subunit B
MKCLYYPGCSQKASSISYERSFLAIAKALGVEIIELEDWNCCGTTVTISVNEILSYTLSARNLAIAEAQDLPLVAPCPSCYISLNKVNKLYKERSILVEKINASLNEGGLKYSGKVKVYNILDFLVNCVGVDKIAEKVVEKMDGIRIAPYYGCQIVNPYATGDDNNDPRNMEKIIEALGAEAVEFPYRTMCCGGSLAFTRRPQAESMGNEILKSIANAGADLVATPCGLCQINLDMSKKSSSKYTGRKISLPVVNVAQLVGIALGTEKTDVTKNIRKSNKSITAEVMQ